MRKLNVDFHISDSFLATDLRKRGVQCAFACPRMCWEEKEIRSSSIAVVVTFKQA